MYTGISLASSTEIYMLNKLDLKKSTIHLVLIFLIPESFEAWQNVARRYGRKTNHRGRGTQVANRSKQASFSLAQKSGIFI